MYNHASFSGCFASQPSCQSQLWSLKKDYLYFSFWKSHQLHPSKTFFVPPFLWTHLLSLHTLTLQFDPCLCSLYDQTTWMYFLVVHLFLHSIHTHKAPMPSWADCKSLDHLAKTFKTWRKLVFPCLRNITQKTLTQSFPVIFSRSKGNKKIPGLKYRILTPDLLELTWKKKVSHALWLPRKQICHS